jgi:serine/threonine protein kinase
MSLKPGSRLGAFEILEHIAAGGMGSVYKARDSRLDRIVAIKVLPDEVAFDPERRERFELDRSPSAALTNYDVTPDGRRFLMIRSGPEDAHRQIRVALNWLRELKELDPNPSR